MNVDTELCDKIKNIANLPTLPQVASHLMRIIRDPETSSSDVAELVGQDLSLSAKVLRLANSAFYGVPHSITNINSAIVVLGFKVIHTMILSLTVFDMFPENRRKVELFDRRTFWMHSLSCGLAAKMLAFKIKKFTMFDPDEAFCAGLLHDIGKVVMEQYLHKDFHLALKTAHKENIPVYDAEKTVLGYTHTEIADVLISGWGLPLEIHLPITNHHNPQEINDHKDIVMLCNMADWICYKSGKIIDARFQRSEPDRECLNQLRINETDIQEVIERLPTELENSAVYIDLAVR